MANNNREATDLGFDAGTIAALAVIYLHDAESLWCDVLRATDSESVLNHATNIDPDAWEWAGFDRYAERNGFKRPMTSAEA